MKHWVSDVNHNFVWEICVINSGSHENFFIPFYMVWSILQFLLSSLEITKYDRIKNK